eukprot:CAMPEP_0172530672 /NCGR_PEP_ID=MMETSP1067-20121228/4335_1 /TAXON_ID=265564 ORGANISM="Thalassiosira punctigera, Strain Tpunct2005C2" /NCGR_SAMPLE_ID=MMETSP1067 /ASSEMBLY_ACC=CAM_ASM_000444 /LENGTH=784 /DNA_ID=CAMNT_0013314917 /DNA_START=150 /DNA_END=2504 /DNA_ORIENTATION=+
MTSYKAKMLVAPSKSAVGPALCDPIVKSCRDALGARDAFSIALSGGSLPSFLQSLPAAFEKAGVDPRWDKWHVLLADERCVVATDEDSNLKAIKENFTSKVPIPEGQVYGIDEKRLAKNTDAVAVHYQEKVVRALLGKCDGMLDCVVLGFGPDGHTCSLFPGHPLLEEDILLVAPIDDSPKPPPSRITLTLPVLNTMSRQVVFCGAGASKSPVLKATFGTALERVGEGVEKNVQGTKAYDVEMITPAPYPCGMVRTGQGGDSLVWVTDAEAAEGAITVEKVTHVSHEAWIKEGLAVMVVGASGDLAKKKTYPSLLSLFAGNLLPKDVVIYGFARSKMSDDDLRSRLRGYLENKAEDAVVEDFLGRCFYQSGSGYGDIDGWKELDAKLQVIESKSPKKSNRLFYFAIPPNVFAETGDAIKRACMAPNGFSRMIVEKPFGRDLESCRDILGRLGRHFDETNLFRIDHYLGKEMTQNLMVMRFGNVWMERVWNRDFVQCVMLTFKEPFGTQGRGGYFDQYGIIRDIIQNHLLQVMCLLCMECPNKLDGPEAGEKIRDEKVRVIEAMPPVTLDEVFLGQYEGYTDDETITNKDSNCPTYALVRCFINNPRWAGVPIIFKAGKALNERKAEMRVQFKDAPAAGSLFGVHVPRNEIVVKLQPEETIYMKSNIKTPGFSSAPIQSELEVKYDTRYFGDEGASNPDAYSRLILDVLRGRSASFVRSDELIRAWEIFTPVLQQIERENVRPHIYKVGSRGPEAADAWSNEKSGYVRNDAYVYHDGVVGAKPGM